MSTETHPREDDQGAPDPLQWPEGSFEQDVAMLMWELRGWMPGLWIETGRDLYSLARRVRTHLRHRATAEPHP